MEAPDRELVKIGLNGAAPGQCSWRPSLGRRGPGQTGLHLLRHAPPHEAYVARRWNGHLGLD
eukprot:2372078-Pyramimonas_sp.AAC.1